MELSLCRAWRCQGGDADLLSYGQKRPSCCGPSRALPVPGGGQILGCVLAPCAPVPALLDSPSRPHSCLHSATARAPLSWSQSPTALSARILFLCRSPLRALASQPPPCGATAQAPQSCSGSSCGPCSLLGSSAAGYGAVSWVRRCLSVLGSPRASLPSWRPAPSPCGCLSTQEDW